METAREQGLELNERPLSDPVAEPVPDSNAAETPARPETIDLQEWRTLFQQPPEPESPPQMSAADPPEPLILPSLTADDPPPAAPPSAVTIELGRTRLSSEQADALRTGSVIALDARSNEPIELRSNGRLVARGEPVVIDGRLSIRLVEVLSSSAHD